MARGGQPQLRWCALKVRFDCPECGSAMFADGPYEEALCSACASRTCVTELWSTLLDRAAEYGAEGRDFLGSTIVLAGAGRPVPSILYAANKGHPPLCTACDEVLDEAEEVADGFAGNFFCPACGTPHPTWPAPAYLSETTLAGGVRARQVFMAPLEDQQGQPPAAPVDARPLVFGCLSCGGNLRITSETPRILTCEYCEVDSFLPSEIWNRLHPIRKRRAFWIRLG